MIFVINRHHHHHHHRQQQVWMFRSIHYYLLLIFLFFVCSSLCCSSNELFHKRHYAHHTAFALHNHNSYLLREYKTLRITNNNIVRPSSLSSIKLIGKSPSRTIRLGNNKSKNLRDNFFALFASNDPEENNNSNNNDDFPSITTTSNSNDDILVLTLNTKPQVYKQRWIQLIYLSLLALLSDWICFSAAATPDIFENAFPTHTASSIIDLFLFTNVLGCFVVTDIVQRIGLQKSIHYAAFIMTIGCWFRCGGISFLNPEPSTVSSYPYIVIGTILVGFAQPFFQCTPPLLSALWFASNERATSTAIALNFNQIGIATAFIVGGEMASSITGLENYFGLIAIISTLITIGTCIQFKDEPLIPPSQSELEKKLNELNDNNNDNERIPFITSAQSFFSKNGFKQALLAFICSISITNVIGAFLEEIVTNIAGIQDQFQIDISGAAFELAILFGGIVIGGYVDRTKQYKNVTLCCLIVSALLIIPLGLSSSIIDSSSYKPILVIGSLLGLGFAVGPVQPINAELAVDVTYPGDETAVESVQQIGGNMISALLIPLAEYVKHQYGNVHLVGNNINNNNQNSMNIDIASDILLLFGVTIFTIIYFSFFNATLLRTNADE